MRISLPRRHVAALLSAAVLIGASPGFEARFTYAAYEGKSLSVPAVEQRASNWCWAGATQSILSYMFGITYCQDTQAANLFSVTCSCGASTISSACNKPATLGQVEYLIEERKGVHSTQEGNDLTYANFKSEINANHPFWIRYGYKPNVYLGLGHIVVVRAYYSSDTQPREIGMMDPNRVGNPRWPWYTWTEFISNPDWQWTNTLWKAWK